MNIRNFVSPEKVEWMAKKIGQREPFDYRADHKEGKEQVVVNLYARFLEDKKVIQDIWHGNDYLVHFSMNRHGKLYAYTGFGFAVDKFWMFDNWDVFKNWFDKRMCSYSDYEREEYGQISLF